MIKHYKIDTHTKGEDFEKTKVPFLNYNVMCHISNYSLIPRQSVSSMMVEETRVSYKTINL